MARLSSRNYRIFHNPRQNNSIYYDNLVMVVDFLDIVGSEDGECVHAVYPRSVDLFVQLQQMNPFPVLPKGGHYDPSLQLAYELGIVLDNS